MQMMSEGLPAVRSSFLGRDVYTLTLTMCREPGEMSLPEFSCWKLRIREISNKNVYQKVNVENSDSCQGETRTGRQRYGTPKPGCAMANLSLFASGPRRVFYFCQLFFGELSFAWRNHLTYSTHSTHS